MTAILRDLKRLLESSKTVELGKIAAALERPRSLVKRGDGWLRSKLTFRWRGCECHVTPEPVPQAGLRRTMYWRGCRYEVVVPSLDAKKATVLK